MPEPRIELLIVDPQVDFMDLPGSQLPVPGATRDMARLAAFDPGNIGKLHLLGDCTSDVQGFEQLGRDFVAELTGQGTDA
jgi:hypothetical protein